jgi:hypothetical protein
MKARAHMDFLYEYKSNTHKIVLFCKMSDSLTFFFLLLCLFHWFCFFNRCFEGFFKFELHVLVIFVFETFWTALFAWQMMNARQMCWCWKDCGVARRQGKEKKSASWFCMWSKHLKCSASLLSNGLYKSNNSVRIVLAVLTERMHIMFSLNVNWPCSAY